MSFVNNSCFFVNFKLNYFIIQKSIDILSYFVYNYNKLTYNNNTYKKGEIKMWTYIHEKECDIDLEKLWNYYSNVNLWKEWDEEVEKVELNGEFVSGTTGCMFMTGMDPMNFILTNVESKKLFIDETSIEPLKTKVIVGHFIEEKSNGRFILRHSVIIDGENADMLAQQIGESFTVDIPKSMEKLIKLSSKG